MKTLRINLIAAAVISLMAASTANAWTTVSPTSFSAEKDTAVLRVRSKSFSDPAFGNQAWAMHGSWAVLNAVKGRTYTITVTPSDASGNPVTANGLHPAVSVWKRPVSYSYTDASGNTVSVNNLALAKYVPDHNFFPAQSYIESGVAQQHVLESGGGSGCKTSWERTIAGAAVTSTPCDFWAAAKRTSAELAAKPGVLLEDGDTDIGYPRMLFVGAAYDADKASPIYNKLDMNPSVKAKKGDGSGNLQYQFTADESVQYQFFLGGINPDNGHTVNFYYDKVVVSGF